MLLQKKIIAEALGMACPDQREWMSGIANHGHSDLFPQVIIEI